MLEPDDGLELISKLWSKVQERPLLPESEADFLKLCGRCESRYDSRRAYERYYYRNRSILTVGVRTIGVYAKDISRLGIGFISPEQFFPGDEVTILVPGPKKMKLRIKRCWRVADRCYDCGAEYVLQPASETGSLA